jgi:Secretion system C-terminal sorting domain
MQNQHLFKCKTFFLLLVTLTFQAANAQIAIGDIAFTGYNSSPVAGSDDFSFIILRTGGLPVNSVINFTDCGWAGTACSSTGLFATNAPSNTETDITWTSPNSILTYGTQVRISALTASLGTVTGTTISLSSLGDQLFAFTGVRTAPTFIAGIQMNVDAGATATGWDNFVPTMIAPTSTTASNRPPCLTDGTYSVWFPTENDNAVINCSVNISTNRATALAQINNSANWNKQDGTAYSLPNACPLPIELLNFQAKNTEVGALLTWQTASEKDNKGFNVQRSSDSKNFENLGFVKGFGTTLQSQNYSYMDNKPLNSTAYYRLKQEDFDGKMDYSSIISIQGKASSSKLKIYPTITKGELTIEGAQHFVITNANGQIVYTQSFNNESLFKIPQLSSGIYFIKGLDTEGGNFLQKIIVTQ